MKKILPSILVLTVLVGFPWPSRAQNAAANPDFDRDVNSWSIVLGGKPSFEESEDVDGCYGSAAMRIASVPSDGAEAVFEQCVPVGSDGTLAVRLRDRFLATTANLGLEAYPDAACGETLLDSTFLYDVSPGGGTWEQVAESWVLPKGTQSVLFQFRTYYGDGTPFDLDVDRIWIGVADPVFWDDFEARSTCRWSAAATACDTGYLAATSFDQGSGVGGLAIAANGTAWVTFANSFGNHMISVTNDDANVDLQMEVWYPDAGFDGCSPPDFVWNEQGTGTGLSELHSTPAAGVAPIPNGDVYIRVRNLAGTAGTFTVFDSD